ncbi:MAG: hypothetical protein DWQ01_22625 [Planctomycetota bacterium]|nr:MAG: hypothetical protein DWQ01_22625 [Planctomycetota bacterium]
MKSGSFNGRSLFRTWSVLLLLAVSTACQKPKSEISIWLPLSGSYQASGEAYRHGFLQWQKAHPQSSLDWKIQDVDGLIQNFPILHELEDSTLVVGPWLLSPCQSLQAFCRNAALPFWGLGAYPNQSENFFPAAALWRPRLSSPVLLARKGRRDLGLLRAFTVSDLQSPESLANSQSFAAEFTALGGMVEDALYYRSGQRDFQEIVESVNRWRPGLVYIPGQARDVADLLEQAYPGWQGTWLLGQVDWLGPELLEMPETARPDGCQAWLTAPMVLQWNSGVKKAASSDPGQVPVLPLERLAWEAAGMIAAAVASDSGPMEYLDRYHQASEASGLKGDPPFFGEPKLLHLSCSSQGWKLRP